MRIRCIVIGLIVLALLAAPMAGTAIAQVTGPVRTALPTKTPPDVPGGPGMTLPPNMTLGDYGRVIPANQSATPMPGTLGKLGPEVPGGPGMTLPPNMTLGDYGRVIPANQMATPMPVRPGSAAGPNMPGGPGIVMPPGMMLGDYGRIVPANQTMAMVTPVPMPRR